MPVAAQDTGWTAAQTAIIVAALIAIFGAIVSAALTYAFNQRAARRERLAQVFAEALQAVEDYAELPYRIRRRRGTPEARYELTEEVSRIQSRLAYHQALLRIEAPTAANAYTRLVRVVRRRAGSQMRDAWGKPVLLADTEMNLRMAYPRRDIDSERARCVREMRKALGRRRK
ncbi:hypothetical protein Val02_48290 [Virgisporangium aliadipatigenens]|uniref:Uncharacterized protein n=1 Tax=Virgisporangium aliadipatigenens TaxID=741659 RepID=A0A8J3YPJ9_9ACTN|nr:hypothetical protein Val02_48290 [Virgisporangium aliadipatigenens]